MSAQNQKTITIAATGGTIATPADYLKENRLTVKELIDKVSSKSEFADITLQGRDFSSLPSSQLAPEDILQLKSECEDIVKEGADGVVITHGTDLLEETAFLLSRLWQREEPLILTGAMRPADSVGEDGPRNLASACKTAAHPESTGRGPLVVLNDDIHHADEVIKSHTWSLDTFVSEHGPAGTIEPLMQPRFLRPKPYRLTVPTPDKVKNSVFIIQGGLGSGSEIVNGLISAGADGIVVQAAGRGSLYKELYHSLSEAAAGGTLIAITSRCPFGSTRDAHPGSNLIWTGRYKAPQVRLMLMLCLSLWGKDLKAARDMFNAQRRCV